MNAEDERFAFRDLRRFPSWPPCIRPFLKESSLENKVSEFFFQWTHKAGTDVTWVTSTLCIPQRKMTRTEAKDLDPGQREGQRSLGLNDMVHLSSLFRAWRKGAGGKGGAVFIYCKHKYRI